MASINTTAKKTTLDIIIERLMVLPPFSSKDFSEQQVAKYYFCTLCCKN
jgi:hypothetical protein